MSGSSSGLRGNNLKTIILFKFILFIYLIYLELLGLVLKQEKIREKKMEMENTFAVSQLSYW